MFLCFDTVLDCVSGLQQIFYWDDSPHYQSGMVHFPPDLCSQCAPEMRRQSIMTSQTQTRDCVSNQHQLLGEPRDVAFQLPHAN